MKEAEFRNWLKKDNPRATARMITDCVRRVRKIEEVHVDIDNVDTIQNIISVFLNNMSREYLPFGRDQRAINALESALLNYSKFLQGLGNDGS